MKISKLFHWLYGFLMLLPVFGVLFKVGYVMLNENAFESYRGEYQFNGWNKISDDEKLTYYDYTLNCVSNLASYLNRNQYKASNTIWHGSFSFTFPINTASIITVGNSNSNALFLTNIQNLIINNIEYNDVNAIVLGSSNFYNSNLTIYTYNFDNDIDLDTLVNSNSYNYLYNQTILHTIDLYNTGGTLSFTKNDNDLRLIGYACGNNDITISQINLLNFLSRPAIIYDNTLSSVFYASLQEINNTEFFSWAKDSFLVQPIMYIGALFGITNPHPIFTFMSYWLAISIIWLVFDLVMYVPLLVHRWIDKGVIE